MRVFVWKYYGTCKVYALETTEQVMNLCKQLCKNVSDWGIDQELSEAMEVFDSDTVNYADALGSLADIVDAIGVGSHDVLEHGSGVSSLIT